LSFGSPAAPGATAGAVANPERKAREAPGASMAVNVNIPASSLLLRAVLPGMVVRRAGKVQDMASARVKSTAVLRP